MCVYRRRNYRTTCHSSGCAIPLAMLRCKFKHTPSVRNLRTLIIDGLLKNDHCDETIFVIDMHEINITDDSYGKCMNIGGHDVKLIHNNAADFRAKEFKRAPF